MTTINIQKESENLFSTIIKTEETELKFHFFFEEELNYTSKRVKENETGEESSSCFLFEESSTGKKVIRFGVDDNFYLLEDFKDLKTFKVGNEITFTEEGIELDLNLAQGYKVKSFIKFPNISESFTYQVCNFFSEKQVLINKEELTLLSIIKE